MTNATVAARAVVVEREFAHPPERVWRALTQGALIEEWLMQNDFQPVQGHRFTFRATPMPHWNGIVNGEVLVVEPVRRLAYRWEASNAAAPDGLKTIVTWTLTPTAGGTLLRMEQSGFGPDDDNNVRGATWGWQKYMGALVQVVDLPCTVEAECADGQSRTGAGNAASQHRGQGRPRRGGRARRSGGRRQGQARRDPQLAHRALRAGLR
jgi:uncharacterized protein YndB with AHSA1/START domain